MPGHPQPFVEDGEWAYLKIELPRGWFLFPPPGDRPGSVQERRLTIPGPDAIVQAATSSVLYELGPSSAGPLIRKLLFIPVLLLLCALALPCLCAPRGWSVSADTSAGASSGAMSHCSHSTQPSEDSNGPGPSSGSRGCSHCDQHCLQLPAKTTPSDPSVTHSTSHRPLLSGPPGEASVLTDESEATQFESPPSGFSPPVLSRTCSLRI